MSNNEPIKPIVNLAPIILEMERVFGGLKPSEMKELHNKEQSIARLIAEELIPSEMLAQITDDQWKQLVEEFFNARAGRKLSVQDVFGTIDMIGYDKDVKVEAEHPLITCATTYTWDDVGVKELLVNFAVFQDQYPSSFVRVGTADVSIIFPISDVDLLTTADVDRDFFEAAEILKSMLDEDETTFAELYPAGVAFINDFFIEPDLRKQGLGAASFKALVKTLRKEHVVFLLTNAYFHGESEEEKQQAPFLAKRVGGFLESHEFIRVKDKPMTYFLDMRDFNEEDEEDFK